jgi:integration host factor subunit beta
MHQRPDHVAGRFFCGSLLLDAHASSFGSFNVISDRLPMIKSELVARLPSNTRIFTSATLRRLSIDSDEIGDAMGRGDRVELRGFGAFSVKQREARIGRNPRTGESVAVARKNAPFFKTGKELRNRLNADSGK